MKRIVYYLLPVLVCLGVGFAGSLFQARSMVEWYPWLDKSVLTPPGVAFPIAWTLLYGRLVGTLDRSGPRPHALHDMGCAVGAQLLVVVLCFFTFRYPLLGLVDILLLDVLALIYIVGAYPRDKAASWLFVPYFLWLLFATYLNGYIYLYN